MVELKRRGLLKSLAKKERLFVNIPYYKDDLDFENKCLSCDNRVCVSACQSDVIYIVENIARIVFSQNGCTYCDECAKVCEKQALHVSEKSIIDATFSINTNKCLAWQGVICSSCKDACLDNAITFLGLFKPLINEKCINCGFCLYPCPVHACEVR